MVVSMADLMASLSDAAARVSRSPPLSALWSASKGNWATAHKIAMNEETSEAAWVHAYLHRVEGDFGNAGYWYRQAGQPAEKDSLEAEWARITAALGGGGAA